MEEITLDDPILDVPVTSDEPAPFVVNEEDPDPNLVRQFQAHPKGPDALKEIADQCRANFDMAWGGTSRYRERVAKDWALFAGETPKKQGQFANMANLHVPIIIENISRVCLRVMGELMQNEQHMMEFIATGPSPEAKGMAHDLTFHTNWQLRRSPDWGRQLYRSVFAFFTIGDVTRYNHWDDARQEIRHEVLQPDDFVVPYVHVSTMSDWSDVPFRVLVLQMYRNELQSKKESWVDVDKVLADRPKLDDEPETPIADASAKKQGVEKTDDGAKKGPPTSPYKVLQYEGWLELPGQDRDRFCKVMLGGPKHDIVMELTIHEHEQWQDVQRFSRQKSEVDSYWQSRDMHEQMMAERQGQMEAHQEMLSSPDPAMQMAAGQAMQMQQQVPEPQAPLPPMWMKNGEDRMEQPAPVKKVPIHLFTHAVCLEPLVGNLGLGFGRIQADLTRAANTLLNHWVDAASFANLSAHFVSNQIEIKDTVIEPGKFIKVDASGQSIRDNIVKIETQPANPQLIEGVKFAYQWGQSSMQSPSVLSGEAGKSGETKGGIMARIGQAMQQVSVVTRKFADEDLKPVFKTHALLNSIYLPEEELFTVHEKVKGESTEFKITRRMYEENYDVEITADLKFATQAQKIDEADELLKAPMACPPLQNDIAFLWHAMKKSLEARNRYDMIPMLGPDPMTLPPGPFGAPVTPFGIPPPPPPGTVQPPGVVPGKTGAPGVPTPHAGTAPEHEQATGGPPVGGPPSAAPAGGPPVGSPQPGPGGPPA